MDVTQIVSVTAFLPLVQQKYSVAADIPGDKTGTPQETPAATVTLSKAFQSGTQSAYSQSRLGA